MLISSCRQARARERPRNGSQALQRATRWGEALTAFRHLASGGCRRPSVSRCDVSSTRLGAAEGRPRALTDELLVTPGIAFLTWQRAGANLEPRYGLLCPGNARRRQGRQDIGGALVFCGVERRRAP